MDGKYSGFIEINKFKQICQFVSVGFKTMKQFVVKDVNFVFFIHLQDTKSICYICKFVITEFLI